MPILNNFEQTLLAITVPSYAFIILLEIFLSNYYGQKNMYSVKDTVTNLIMTLLNALLDGMMRFFTLLMLNKCFEFRFFNTEALKLSSPIIYWSLVVIGWEFMFYWLHRLEHSSRFFWATHSTHHSSEHYNLSVGFRSSVFEPLFRFVFFLPLSFLGIEPLDFFLIYSVTQIYGLLVHTQYVGRIPVWEWFFVTPAHHRVHHASNIPYLDKNMGMFLIVWDRIFGTFAEEMPNVKTEYGLLKKEKLNNPLDVIFYEWRNIFSDVKRRDLNLQTKLNYIFKAPGWSHDGSRKTAIQLQNELNDRVEANK